MFAGADDGVAGDHGLDPRQMQADVSRRMPRRVNDVNAAAIGETFSAFDHMLDIIARRLMNRRHVELMRHHLELERLLEFLQPAGVIAVAMRQARTTSNPHAHDPCL